MYIISYTIFYQLLLTKLDLVTKIVRNQECTSASSAQPRSEPRVPRSNTNALETLLSTMLVVRNLGSTQS